MATLAKFQPVPVDDNQLTSLSSSIPAPFSSTDRAYILRTSQSSPSNHPITPTSLPPDLPSCTQEAEAQHLRETLSRTDEESLIQVITLTFYSPTIVTFNPGSGCHAFDNPRSAICSYHSQ
jgi:hypothetical protein